jgi:hypothetical protein
MICLQTRTLVTSLGMLHYFYNTLSNIMICTIIYIAKHGICVLSYSVHLTNDIFTDKEPSSVSWHVTLGYIWQNARDRNKDHIPHSQTQMC